MIRIVADYKIEDDGYYGLLEQYLSEEDLFRFFKCQKWEWENWHNRVTEIQRRDNHLRVAFGAQDYLTFDIVDSTAERGE